MRQQVRINWQNKLQQAQTPQTQNKRNRSNAQLQREKRIAEAAKELDRIMRAGNWR